MKCSLLSSASVLTDLPPPVSLRFPRDHREVESLLSPASRDVPANIGALTQISLQATNLLWLEAAGQTFNAKISPISSNSLPDASIWREF